MTVVHEEHWNCAQCRTMGISGLLQNCPNCNEPHDSNLDPSEEWYLPKDARVLTTSEELDYANSGPKWNCGNCGQSNRGDQDKCGECKNARSGDDRVAAVTAYVDGVNAENVELSSRDQLETDWVDATLQAADPLQVIEDEPVSQPTRTLSSKDDVPTTGWDPYMPRTGAEGDDTSEPSDSTYRSHDGPRKLSDGESAFAGILALLADFRRPIMIASVALVLLGLIGFGGKSLYDNYIATFPVDVRVQSLSWERQVEVEELRTLTQEDWDYPSDARVLGSRREIRSYREVLDHYETRTRQVPETKQTGTRTERYACGSKRVSNGNGTSTTETTYCEHSVPEYTTVYRTETYQDPVYRSEPVYDIKYRYEIDRWVTDHWDMANSSINGTTPVWPGATVRGSKQRVGDERHETYGVVLIDNEGRTFDKSFGDESTWSKLAVGMVLKGEQTRKGALREVTWP